MKRNRSIMLVVVMSACLLGACSSGDSSSNDAEENGIRAVFNEGDSPVALTDNQVAEILMATNYHCMNLANIKMQQRYNECGYSECSVEEINQINAEVLGSETTWENGEPCDQYFSNEQSYDDNLAELIPDIGAYCHPDAEKSTGGGLVSGTFQDFQSYSQSYAMKEMYCREIKMVLDGADLTSE